MSKKDTSKAHWLARLLSLRRGDLDRGILLFFYYFLIIASYTVGLVARDTLFLEEFQAIHLPYVDIATAVLTGLFVAGYLRIAGALSLRSLLLGSLLFFAANAAFFGWAAHYHRWLWLYPALYVWVGIFGAVAAAQVWTLASDLLTTREAKRVFGLIGSGGILGGIFSGFYAKAMTKRFGTESLLFVIALFLTICSVLIILIWRQRKKSMATSGEPKSMTYGKGPRNLRESFGLVWASRHLRAISVLICVSSIVTTIAGWQFRATAKEFLIEKDALAAYLGAFYGYAGVASLLAQLLLTSRVLKRFGLGVALFILPAALAACSGGMLVWGTLWAATLLKGSDKVLRYSIDSAALQLLYLPISAKVKMQVKSFIDSVIWRLGDGLAGLTLLILATFLHLSPSQISWVSLVLLGLWMATAWEARRQYVATLRDGIEQHRLAAEQASDPMMDRSISAILAGNLNAAEPKEILDALSHIRKGQQPAPHPVVRDLLEHPSPDVCQKALSILSAAGDKKVLRQVEHLLRDEHLDVRAKAMSYLAHHGHVDPLAYVQDLQNFPDFSIRSAMVAFLARSGEPDNLETAKTMMYAMVREKGVAGQKTRLAAARLIGTLPDCFEELLFELLEDPDIEVERQAIRSAGKLRKEQSIPHLLARLSDPRIRPDIAESLSQFGDSVVETLRDHLLNPVAGIELRRAIPGVLVRIATPEAERVLVESLLEGDTVLRLRIISSLNKLRRSHPEVEIDIPLIETVLAAEIMGHYRSYQILGTLGGHLESDDAVAQALKESMKQELERIFRLMQLLFPRHDLHSAYFGLQSNDAVVHDNALEFLDNILKPQIRQLLVPLLDSEINVAERVTLANRLVGAKVGTQKEAVIALLHSQDPWLKSCAAYAVGTMGLKSLEPELDNWLNDPDPLLRETVRQAKLRLAKLSEISSKASSSSVIRDARFSP